jgi:hypothetical protein
MRASGIVHEGQPVLARPPSAPILTGLKAVATALRAELDTKRSEVDMPGIERAVAEAAKWEVGGYRAEAGSHVNTLHPTFRECAATPRCLP